MPVSCRQCWWSRRAENCGSPAVAVLGPGGDTPVVATTGAVHGQSVDMPVVATTGAVLG